MKIRKPFLLRHTIHHTSERYFHNVRHVLSGHKLEKFLDPQKQIEKVQSSQV